MSRAKILLTLTLLFPLAAGSAVGEVVYVDPNATGFLHDGSSWCQAYRELTDALASVIPGEAIEIRVADGTCRPDPKGLEDPREATFLLPGRITIEGGYAGCGATEPNQREPAAHPTVLSGDLRGDDSSGQRGDNAYSVVTVKDTSAPTILDGLTITSGNGADGGGSLLGGGIHIEKSELTIRSCFFRGNSSTGGGAVSNREGDVTAVNCVFSGNSAVVDGGAILNDSASLVVMNCTVAGNTAPVGAGIRNYAGAEVEITNSILWDNVAGGSAAESAQIENTAGTTVINYSVIQGWTGGFGGVGNSGVDPRFIDADGPDDQQGTEVDDLRLSLDSPCLDSGTADGAPTSDVAGHERPCGVGIDLGAYENDCTLTDPDARWIAVACNDSQTGSGMLRAVSASPPWTDAAGPLDVGRESILRFANERLYALSRAEDRISVVDPEAWSVVREYTLDEGSGPRDIAVVSRDTAYVTRGDARHLLRLDLSSGAVEEVVDLGVFADSDGIPDLEMMAIHEGRLFVQIRRISSSDPGAFASPAYLAVVDIASEELIDADPATSGIQAIELAGTAPKFKMQIQAETRRLFLSATGGAFDAGGIEIIDLDSLQSLGLVVREDDGLTGSDLGPFLLVDTDRGYLAFTTDLILSTHLLGFSVSRGVDPPPQLWATVDYLAPTLERDAGARAFYCPSSGSGGDGVHVFEEDTGRRLTAYPIPTDGPPTDLVLIPPPTSFTRGDANAKGSTDISDGIFILSFLFLGGSEPPCQDAADTDDTGQLDITDAVYILGYLFQGGPPPAEPFGDCGFDSSADNLTCASFEPCDESQFFGRVSHPLSGA